MDSEGAVIRDARLQSQREGRDEAGLEAEVSEKEAEVKQSEKLARSSCSEAWCLGLALVDSDSCWLWKQ